MKGYKNLREAIIRAHDRGKTQREIADFLGIALWTVNKAIKRFEETESHDSPDLNPLDYAVWSILEEKACQKPYPNVESLKKALKKAWKEINLDTLVKIVDNFPKRLKACIDVKGGHFE